MARPSDARLDHNVERPTAAHDTSGHIIAASFVNRANKFAFGTVGMPMPGTQLKLAPSDSEILIKSPGVMQGYHNMPEATANCMKSRRDSLPRPTARWADCSFISNSVIRFSPW